MHPDPIKFKSVEELVDKVIDQVGSKIVLGLPLGLGKPIPFVNALYQKVKNDDNLHLTILTALTLQRPQGKSLLEKRFLGPFADRVFSGIPDLIYEIDRLNGHTPKNIEIIEFYFPPGKYVGHAKAQQNYISSNYTHVVRDLLDRGVNVAAQMVALDPNSDNHVSLSCNPDVTLDLCPLMRKRAKNGKKVALVGQVNPNLPFMEGDAVVEKNFFDFILDERTYDFPLFGPPKMKVTDADHMIGLHISSLIKDGGELQIGIGALGDAVVHSMILRNEQNLHYVNLLKEFQCYEKYGSVMQKLGGNQGTFQKGLFAATEMFIDGFLHLFKHGIVKKKVYDHAPLQRLLNSGRITEKINHNTLTALLGAKIISFHLNESEFSFLQKWGIFKGPEELKLTDDQFHLKDGTIIKNDLRDSENYKKVNELLVRNGKELLGGDVIQGGFFLGPKEFYNELRKLTSEQRSLINMKSVASINQLYGHEEIDRLHRTDARFINTCMMMTLSGSAVSDGLENGHVISGVGGQYNFVAMAQELPSGHSILNLRSTRNGKNGLVSNIVPNYGHITIPRHLRDIVVTEYGVADLRGKTDQEIIIELLKICDTRFQGDLLDWAKKNKKIDSHYKIPEIYRNNLPSSYDKILQKYRQEFDYFNPFPFGHEFNEDELKIGKALKGLKGKSSRKFEMLTFVLKSLLRKKDSELKEYEPYLKRMGLNKVSGFKEKLYRKLLVQALKDFI